MISLADYQKRGNLGDNLPSNVVKFIEQKKTFLAIS